MRKPLLFLALLLSLLVVAGVVFLRFWAVASNGYQDADTPLGMPASGNPDHRFLFLSPWQTACIPRALRFDLPMGTEHGALVYNAQKFWDMNEQRGGHHTGDDLNGIGGMDTDLCDPVYATADGLVVYTGVPSAGWGKVLIIAHKTQDGRTLHSMYAHLNSIDVTRGSLVARGAIVATVGTANGRYPAHLHFEMHASDGIDIGGGYTSVPLNHLNPSGTVNAMRNAAADDLSPSPLVSALAGNKY